MQVAPFSQGAEAHSLTSVWNWCRWTWLVSSNSQDVWKSHTKPFLFWLLQGTEKALTKFGKNIGWLCWFVLSSFSFLWKFFFLALTLVLHFLHFLSCPSILHHNPQCLPCNCTLSWWFCWIFQGWKVVFLQGWTPRLHGPCGKVQGSRLPKLSHDVGYHERWMGYYSEHTMTGFIWLVSNTTIPTSQFIPV